MRAIFFRKESEIRAREFTLTKVITLPIEQYTAFTQNLLQDYDFIRENVDLMGEKDGVWQCILVTGDGTDEGVLVESEGASYARYAAFVPSVKVIIEQYQAMQELQANDMKMGM